MLTSFQQAAGILKGFSDVQKKAQIAEWLLGLDEGNAKEEDSLSTFIGLAIPNRTNVVLEWTISFLIHCRKKEDSDIGLPETTSAVRTLTKCLKRRHDMTPSSLSIHPNVADALTRLLRLNDDVLVHDIALLTMELFDDINPVDFRPSLDAVSSLLVAASSVAVRTMCSTVQNCTLPLAARVLQVYSRMQRVSGNRKKVFLLLLDKQLPVLLRLYECVTGPCPSGVEDEVAQAIRDAISAALFQHSSLPDWGMVAKMRSESSTMATKKSLAAAYQLRFFDIIDGLGGVKQKLPEGLPEGYDRSTLGTLAKMLPFFLEEYTRALSESRHERNKHHHDADAQKTENGIGPVTRGSSTTSHVPYAVGDDVFRLTGSAPCGHAFLFMRCLVGPLMAHLQQQSFGSANVTETTCARLDTLAQLLELAEKHGFCLELDDSDGTHLALFQTISKLLLLDQPLILEASIDVQCAVSRILDALAQINIVSVIGDVHDESYKPTSSMCRLWCLATSVPPAATRTRGRHVGSPLHRHVTKALVKLAHPSVMVDMFCCAAKENGGAKCTPLPSLLSAVAAFESAALTMPSPQYVKCWRAVAVALQSMPTNTREWTAAHCRTACVLARVVVALGSSATAALGDDMFSAKKVQALLKGSAEKISGNGATDDKMDVDDSPQYQIEGQPTAGETIEISGEGVTASEETPLIFHCLSVASKAAERLKKVFQKQGHVSDSEVSSAVGLAAFSEILSGCYTGLQTCDRLAVSTDATSDTKEASGMGETILLQLRDLLTCVSNVIPIRESVPKKQNTRAMEGSGSCEGEETNERNVWVSYGMATLTALEELARENSSDVPDDDGAESQPLPGSVSMSLLSSHVRLQPWHRSGRSSLRMAWFADPWEVVCLHPLVFAASPDTSFAKDIATHIVDVMLDSGGHLSAVLDYFESLHVFENSSISRWVPWVLLDRLLATIFDLHSATGSSMSVSGNTKERSRKRAKKSHVNSTDDVDDVDNVDRGLQSQSSQFFSNLLDKLRTKVSSLLHRTPVATQKGEKSRKRTRGVTAECVLDSSMEMELMGEFESIFEGTVQFPLISGKFKSNPAVDELVDRADLCARVMGMLPVGALSVRSVSVTPENATTSSSCEEKRRCGEKSHVANVDDTVDPAPHVWAAVVAAEGIARICLASDGLRCKSLIGTCRQLLAKLALLYPSEVAHIATDSFPLFVNEADGTCVSEFWANPRAHKYHALECQYPLLERRQWIALSQSILYNVAFELTASSDERLTDFLGWFMKPERNEKKKPNIHPLFYSCVSGACDALRELESTCRATLLAKKRKGNTEENTSGGEPGSKPSFHVPPYLITNVLPRVAECALLDCETLLREDSSRPICKARALGMAAFAAQLRAFSLSEFCANPTPHIGSSKATGRNPVPRGGANSSARVQGGGGSEDSLLLRMTDRAMALCVRVVGRDAESCGDSRPSVTSRTSHTSSSPCRPNRPCGGFDESSGGVSEAVCASGTTSARNEGVAGVESALRECMHACRWVAVAGFVSHRRKPQPEGNYGAGNHSGASGGQQAGCGGRSDLHLRTPEVILALALRCLNYATSTLSTDEHSLGRAAEEAVIALFTQAPQSVASGILSALTMELTLSLTNLHGGRERMVVGGLPGSEEAQGKIGERRAMVGGSGAEAGDGGLRDMQAGEYGAGEVELAVCSRRAAAAVAAFAAIIRAGKGQRRLLKSERRVRHLLLLTLTHLVSASRSHSLAVLESITRSCATAGVRPTHVPGALLSNAELSSRSPGGPVQAGGCVGIVDRGDRGRLGGVCIGTSSSGLRAHALMPEGCQSDSVARLLDAVLISVVRVSAVPLSASDVVGILTALAKVLGDLQTLTSRTASCVDTLLSPSVFMTSTLGVLRGLRCVLGVMQGLARHRPAACAAGMACFIGAVRSALLCVTEVAAAARSIRDREDSSLSPASFDEVMRSASDTLDSLGRFYQSLGSSGPTLRRASVLLTAEFVSIWSRHEEHPSLAECAGVRVLRAGLFSVMALCSPDDLQQIFSLLPPAARPSFRTLYTLYQRKFRYTGKA